MNREHPTAIPHAVAEIYQRHAADLVGYATVLVGPSRAEDAVADAMARVLPSIDLAGLANPRAYLFRCVLNQVRLDARSERARLRRERLVSAWAYRQAAGSPVAVDLGLLHVLSVRERAVVYLTYWEDQSPASVAAVLGIGEGSVRRYLARAREKLRVHLIKEAGAAGAPAPLPPGGSRG